MDVRFIPTAAAFSQELEIAYDTLLKALGTSAMEEAFFSCVREITEVDRIYCFAQRAQSPAPELFCSWVPTDDSTTLINRYRAVYHRFDPIRSVLSTIPDAGCASITFRAEEVVNNDYRRDCFDRFSIRHRLSIIKHVGSSWLTLSVARRSRSFGSADIDRLSSLGRLSLPIMAKNQLLQVKATSGHLSVVELERRLEALVRGLTERERQVCARTIVGMSAEATALDLGIGVASVMTYRRRAYRRTKVSSAMQLVPLVVH